VGIFPHSYTGNGECKRQNEGAIIFGHFVQNLTQKGMHSENIPHTFSGQIMTREIRAVQDFHEECVSHSARCIVKSGLQHIGHSF